MFEGVLKLILHNREYLGINTTDVCTKRITVNSTTQRVITIWAHVSNISKQTLKWFSKSDTIVVWKNELLADTKRPG